MNRTQEVAVYRAAIASVEGVAHEGHHVCPWCARCWTEGSPNYIVHAEGCVAAALMGWPTSIYPVENDTIEARALKKAP